LNNKPSFIELRCQVYSLLSQCCRLGGDIKPQIRVLRKALHVTDDPAVRHEYASYIHFYFLNTILYEALTPTHIRHEH
jgi:hypothetical protein